MRGGGHARMRRSLVVAQVALSLVLLMPGAPGNTGNKDRDAPLVDSIGVRAGYVEAMGIRIVAGRAFERVRRPEVREAVIDTQLARQFFPGASPLGAKIPFGGKQISVRTKTRAAGPPAASIVQRSPRDQPPVCCLFLEDAARCEVRLKSDATYRFSASVS